MSDTLFSTQWYRVAKLTPRLRSNVINSRHYYRGELWYVLTASSNTATLRLDAASFYFVAAFDGKRSVEEIWQQALHALADDAPTQDDVVQLLADLFDAALVDFRQTTDVDQLFENASKRQRSEATARYLNPLFIRLSVFDPDRVVARLLPYTKWMFSPRVFALWLALMLIAGGMGAFLADDLRREFDSDLFSPRSLLIFWLVFPVMKLVHEASHALAVRRWGGEVHEFGIALLILMPVPYVDASESARFASKYRRMAVAGAGIMAETTLACLALMLWSLVEPGLVREIAFNVFVTGALSSLLFNGNPLLKFDAYYVLADFIEIPNLAQRSSRYLTYLLKRRLLGVRSQSPVTAEGEKTWFVLYGVAAFCYRITLSLGIALMIAGKYFFFGVLLAAWSLLMQVVKPLLGALGYLLRSPAMQGHRLRALALAGIVGGLSAASLFWVPIASVTHARGVIWPVDEAMVRAETDCLVTDVITQVGQVVTPGTDLIQCDLTLVDAQVRHLRAEVDGARARLFASRARVDRVLRQTELRTAEAMLSSAESELQGARPRARLRGRFFVPDASNLVGRYFAQGEVIGYVLDPDHMTVKTMLHQERVALLEDARQVVDLTLPSAPALSFASAISRRVPAASQRIAAPALAVSGGGKLLTERAPDGTERLYQAAFEVEVLLPDALRTSLVGEPVELRFDHGTTTLAGLIGRELRLLFLSRLDV